MPLIRGTDTLRVDHSTHPAIHPDEWYELAKELNFSQAAKLQAYQSMRFNLDRETTRRAAEGSEEETPPDEANNRMQVEFDLAGLQVTQLQTYLVRWCHKAAINGQTVSHLDPVTANVLLGVIRELMAGQPGVMSANLKKG